MATTTAPTIAAQRSFQRLVLSADASRQRAFGQQHRAGVLRRRAGLVDAHDGGGQVEVLFQDARNHPAQRKVFVEGRR